MLNRCIEEVSLNSWPALQQILFDGWVLRFANGYTKRANSVNPLYSSNLDIGEKVAVCERIYLEKGLRSIFRLTPFAPPELDHELENRGYEKIDLTHVMHLDLRELQLAPAAGLRDETSDDWMEIFCGLRAGERVLWPL
jgi:hypothetical protein